MTFTKHLFGAATAIALLAGPSSAQDFDTVIADVNGTIITLAHVAAVRDQLPEQYRSLPEDVLFNGIIDQLISQTLLEQSLTDIPAWVDITVENNRRSALATIVAQQVEKVTVTEDTIREAYEDTFLNGDQPAEQEFNASHILVATQDEANALIEQLEGGADFATLAREFSTGPSGPNGGNLGWFGPGRMVPEFERAVTSLDVGAISEPVKTDFGWHVIILNDTRPVQPPAFEDVRGDIELTLQREAVDAHVEGLKAAGSVARNPNDIPASVLFNLNLDDM